MMRQLLLLSLILCAVTIAAVATREKDPAYKIVNKQVSLEKYIPQDIVDFNGIQASKRIVPDLEKLLFAAKKEGLTLKVVSGYRSYDKQINTFESWVKKELERHPHWTREQAEAEANTYSAKPGHSEHQLGTTVDILSSENDYKFSADPKLKYIRWLEDNCQKYNFKISYPKTQIEYTYEPWHLRWYPSLGKIQKSNT